MKVILLKDVRNVGRQGDIKDVADGYARNMLLPHKAACLATLDKIKEMESQRAARDAARAREEQQMDQKISSLNAKKVTISSRATEKGGLFKAVSPEDVAKAVRAEHSLEVPAVAISLAEPIKTLGMHTAVLQGVSQKANLSIEVVAA